MGLSDFTCMNDPKVTMDASSFEIFDDLILAHFDAVRGGERAPRPNTITPIPPTFLRVSSLAFSGLHLGHGRRIARSRNHDGKFE